MEEPDPGGRRAEGPESQPGGRLRGAKRDIPEGSPEEASCGQQGRRPHRRAPDLSGGARGTRAAPRGVGGTGPGRQSSSDRIGSEQREGEAMRHGGVPECKDRPGAEACGRQCGLQEAPCFPRRGPGGWRFQQCRMHLRPLFASRRETANAAPSLPHQSYSSP